MRSAVFLAGRVCLALFVVQLALDVVYFDIPMALGWALLAVAVAAPVLAGRRPDVRNPPPAVLTAPPVHGSWSALNTPARRVPSHHTHALGQTWAIDVVGESAERPRPAVRWWPWVRRNGSFPAFGRPVYAVADGTVVRAVDRRRDHLSRNSWLALLYFFVVEGLVRSMGNASWLLGNHLVLRLDDGTYALYAHLRRGSLRVREGERVERGAPLAECGNSGNSSEPHLHFQLMDHPRAEEARGLPFRWEGVGVPGQGEWFHVAAEAPAP